MLTQLDLRKRFGDSLFLRAAATLYPLFIFYRYFILSPFTGHSFLIWASEDATLLHSILFGLILVASMILIWSRFLGSGLLILGMAMIVQREINPIFVLTWARILLLVMIFRYLSLFLKNESIKRKSYYFYLFFVLSVYWVSILDRLEGTLWFDGTIVASFLSTPYFSHFPLFIPVEYYKFLAPLSITAYLIEASGPFAYLFWRQKRKTISYIMMAFHTSIMFAGDVEMWQPLMIIIWWDLSGDKYHITKSAKAIIVGMILLTSPYSFLPILKPASFIVQNKPVQFLNRVGVFNFQILHLFSSPVMPIYSSYKMNLITGDEKIEVHSGLSVLFLRYFIGFYLPYPQFPLSSLCQKDDEGQLKLEVDAVSVGWSVRKIAEADCRSGISEAKESYNGGDWVKLAPPQMKE